MQGLGDFTPKWKRTWKGKRTRVLGDFGFRGWGLDPGCRVSGAEGL